jgi:hypothetical protein
MLRSFAVASQKLRLSIPQFITIDEGGKLDPDALR